MLFFIFKIFCYRLCFVSGREGHFLEPMSYVHVNRSTPGPAVALSVQFCLFIYFAYTNAMVTFPGCHRISIYSGR